MMRSVLVRLHAWLGELLGASKSVAAHADSTGAAAQLNYEETQNVVPYDENLLEQSRLQWQLGDWASLTQLTRETLQHHPDRAKLALLAAAGQLQSNNAPTAKQFIRLALDWGCSKKMASQVLVAGVYSTLGTAATAGGDQQRALRLLKAAATVNDQKANSALLAETQMMRARMRLAPPLQVASHSIPMGSQRIDTPAQPEVGIATYAQNFEDVMLWRALGRIESGFYIDVGAHDPEFDSVSKSFYERGWRGVHVEPIPEYANRLRSARPDERVVEAALGATPGAQTIYQVNAAALSTGIKEIADRHKENGLTVQPISVVVSTLSILFDEVGSCDVHWLKIDVEGMECEVLQGWGEHPLRPWIVLIEATEPCSQIPTTNLWEFHLIDRDYSFVYFDGLNRFYVHATQRQLMPLFSAPPNVFDNFWKIPSSRSIGVD